MATAKNRKIDLWLKMKFIVISTKNANLLKRCNNMKTNFCAKTNPSFLYLEGKREIFFPPFGKEGRIISNFIFQIILEIYMYNSSPPPIQLELSESSRNSLTILSLGQAVNK